jgi:hypothetical protein
VGPEENRIHKGKLGIPGAPTQRKLLQDELPVLALAGEERSFVVGFHSISTIEEKLHMPVQEDVGHRRVIEEFSKCRRSFCQSTFQG